MARATEPVSVGGLTFDALIEENRNLTAAAPAFPVEGGFEISDSIIAQAETLDMVLYLTDAPVTWRGLHGGNPMRVADAIGELERKYFASEPLTVTTTDSVYEDMAITSITLTKSAANGTAREIPISFQKIRTTEKRTAAIPASYGRGGLTGANAGVAQTMPGTASGPAPAWNFNIEGGSTGSILHGLANAAGLLGGGRG